MDRFRAAVGVLAFAYFTHWALTSPAPAPAPRAPRLAGHWTLVWGGTRADCWLMQSGAYGCDWCGCWWCGTWRQERRPDGSSTLTVDEGLSPSQGGCRWSVEMEPGKRKGKTVPGGVAVSLEVPEGK